MKRQKIAVNRYVFKCPNCGLTVGKQKTENAEPENAEPENGKG